MPPGMQPRGMFFIPAALALPPNFRYNKGRRKEVEVYGAPRLSLARRACVLL